MSLSQVKKLMRAQNVAILGASEDTTKWGGSILRLLRQHGFPESRIHPIHPKYDQIQGLKAWKEVGDIGVPIDLALIVLPAEIIEEAVRNCAIAGVGACLIISANFAEVGEEGAVRQQKIVNIANEYGMRLIGPNCLGIVNTQHQFNLCNSSAAQFYSTLKPGVIGIVSQSGAMMGMMMARAYAGGQGVSSTVSVGNQADLELCDFLEYLIDDENTHVITLYIEGLKSPERFVALCRKAIKIGKPVLVTKAGRSDQGAQAVQSHTGSLAGSHASFEATCRSIGVLVLDDPCDLMDIAMAYASIGSWSSGGVAIMTASGGAGALTIDAFESLGLQIPLLTDATKATLEKFLPASHLQLPFDVGALAAHGATKDIPAAIHECMKEIMSDPNVGAGVYVMTTQPRAEMIGRFTVDLAKSCGKPFFLVNLASEVGASAGVILKEAGILEIDRISVSANVLSKLRQIGTTLKSESSTNPNIQPLDKDFKKQLPHTNGAQVTLSEAQTKQLLKDFGIPIPNQFLATSEDEAIKFAIEIGYPVVLKIEAEKISHKSDVGGVFLNLSDSDQVRKAFKKIQQIALDSKTEIGFKGALVQQMVLADAELIVGSRWDESFGPMLLIGTGGTLVELIKDTKLLPAPVSQEQVLQALSELKLFPLLTGYRGSKPVDLSALSAVIEHISHFVASLGDRLIEFDVNPLCVSKSSIYAADARAVIH